MTRISVLGATGRVGKALLDMIATSPDVFTLAEAISASGDAGRVVALQDARLDGADVLVDFSTPAGTLHLLERLANNALPLVVGTTGFTDEQAARLRSEGQRRPILVGANFTKGFEDFAAAATALATALPGSAITVGEIYNENKKPTASGTTLRLSKELGAASGGEIAADIRRIGDTPGVNAVTLDYGVATIRLELSVRSRDAYAAGSLDAARWLVGRPNGFYEPKDIIS